MKNEVPAQKVVVITGASSGIGAATALACGRKGMQVALIARRVAELEKVADQIRALGSEALVLPFDLTLPGATEEAISQVVEKFGRIDVLVLCAGRGFHQSVEQASVPDIENLVQLNYLSTINASRAALPVMRKQGSGHVVLVGSVAAEVMFPNDALYTSVKAAVHRLGRGLRNELRGSGINVSLVIPGIVETDLTAGLNGLPKSSPDLVARDIVACMGKSRFRVVTPRWYGWILVVSKIAPTPVSRFIERRVNRPPASTRRDSQAKS